MDHLLRLLDLLGISYGLHRHAPVRTVADSGAVRQGIHGTLCKRLLLKDSEKHYLLAMRADARADLKALAVGLGSGRLSFGTEDELRDLLGSLPGAVSVFGLVADNSHAVIPVIDRALLGTGQPLLFHPLVNTATVTVTEHGLFRFLEHTGHCPVILDVASGSTGDSGFVLPLPWSAKRRNMGSKAAFVLESMLR